MPYNRGDVVLVNFPFADASGIKRRPALVVQSDAHRPWANKVIIAQISSNMGRIGATRVVLRKGSPEAAGSNLIGDSVVLLDVVAALENSLIYKRIGHLTDMTPVDTALRTVFAV